MQTMAAAALWEEIDIDVMLRPNSAQVFAGGQESFLFLALS